MLFIKRFFISKISYSINPYKYYRLLLLNFSNIFLFMKTILITFIFILNFSCSPSHVSKNNIKENFHKIVGIWEAEELGDVLIQSGYNLPSKLIFRNDKTYTWQVHLGGISMLFKGTYKIDDNQSPSWIDLSQETSITHKKKKKLHGIFKFFNKNKLKIIFHDIHLLKRSLVFSALDTQIYRKVSNDS